jgi:uncharacterized protein YjlB
MKYLLLILFLFMVPAMVLAQPGFGDDVDDVPIEGGLVLLLAAGIGHIASKSRKKNPAK